MNDEQFRYRYKNADEYKLVQELNETLGLDTRHTDFVSEYRGGPKKERASRKVCYTEQEYQELQQNLVLYKQGSREAASYIVKTFHTFLTKYVRFIKLGDLPHVVVDMPEAEKKLLKNRKTFIRTSPTISSFVSLYVNKSDFSCPKPTQAEKQKVFSNTCFKIKELFSQYNYIEIYNELVLALLNMANKYKITQEGDKYHKKNGTFHMYVSKCFHWEARNFLNKLIKDPITHSSNICLKDCFDDMDLDESSEVFITDKSAAQDYEIVETNISRENSFHNSNLSFLSLKETAPLSPYDDDSINFNWIRGITCDDIFKGLDDLERRIIQLRYVHNKTDKEIGMICGIRNSQVSHIRRNAISNLRKKAIAYRYLKY